MQELQKMFCPSCGSPIKFIEGREYTYCQYCGYQVYRNDSDLELKLKHDAVKMYYNDKREERQFQYKKNSDDQLMSIVNGIKDHREKKAERKIRKYEAKQKTRAKLFEHLDAVTDIVLVVIALIILLIGISM